MLVSAMVAAGLLAAGCDSRGEGAEPPGTSTATSPSSPSESTPDPSTLGSASSGLSSSLAPVPRVFDARTMQASVARILTQSYRVEGVEAVSCPPRQPVEAGLTFDCTAVIAGEAQRVPITVLGRNDEYEVGYPE
ncbi:DUF4333 domain-containing protein [Prauserella oleivorans]